MDSKCGRRPARIGGVTSLAIRPNPYSSMWWIGRVIVIGEVATDTRIWRILVIPVMTQVAVVDCSMRPGELIIGVMNGECGRRPARIGSMTCLAIGSYPYSCMWWIGRIVVISKVTTDTGIWRILIIPVMT